MAVETSAQDGTKKADEGGGTTLDRVLSRLDGIKTQMDNFDKVIAAKKGDDGDLTLQHEGQEITQKGEGEGVQGGQTPPNLQPQGDSKADPKADAGKKAKAKADDDDEDEDKKDDSKKSESKGDAKGKGKAKADDDEDEEKKDDAKGKSKSKAKADDDDDDDRKDDSAKAKKRSDFKGEDEQEKEVAKGDARADELEVLRQRLARLESRDSLSEDDEAAYSDAQARADEVYSAFGKRAPKAQLGESLAGYRKRLITGLKQHSPEWKDVKLSDVPSTMIDMAERRVYADALVAAQNPTDLGEGEMRQVVKVDPMTGMRRIMFYGKESFIKDFSRPGRRVAAFNVRNNRADAR